MKVSRWRSLFAPVISAAVLSFFLWQMITHVQLLSGLSAGPSYALAFSVLAAGFLASTFALHLRLRSPQRFARLSSLVRLH